MRPGGECGRGKEQAMCENSNSATEEPSEADGQSEAAWPNEQDCLYAGAVYHDQTQYRAERLQALTAPLSQLYLRLLATHRGWEIQQCLHLDHASIEIRAHCRAGAVVAECRRAEDLRWQGAGAIEVSIVRLADFRVAGLPEIFRDGPDRPSLVMDRIAREVQQEVLAQALLEPPGAADPVQQHAEW